MRFLVTGATGFAGPHLVSLLVEEGHEVVAFVRDPQGVPVETIQGDLSDPDSIAAAFDGDPFDGVFHLGAFSHPPSSFNTPLLALQTNAMGTARICEEILKRTPDCVLMQCSSPEVYGICPADSKITEDTPLRPNNPYAVGKAAADLYVLERVQSAGLRAFLTRAFSHTGPRRRSNFSISSDAIQIARIMKSKQDSVIRVGNMTSQRIVADVRDIVTVYYRLMCECLDERVSPGEVYHIAGDELHSMQYYLDVMLEQNRLEVDQVVDPALFRKVDIPIQIPDDTKVRKFLNWEPQIPIEKTLRDLVDYWLEIV